MARKVRPRVFLDSNVLFSGLYSEEGPPGEILGLHSQGEIIVVVSQQVLEELVRNVREKLPRALPALGILLTNNPPEVVSDPSREAVDQSSGVINMQDAPILAAAMLARPDFLVTGNTRHFVDNPEVARFSGLSIMTPAQFIEYFRALEGEES